MNDMKDIIKLHIETLFPKKYIDSSTQDFVSITLNKDFLIRAYLSMSSTKKTTMLSIIIDDIYGRFWLQQKLEPLRYNMFYIRNIPISSPKFDPEQRFNKITKHLKKCAKLIESIYEEELKSIKLSTKRLVNA